MLRFFVTVLAICSVAIADLHAQTAKVTIRTSSSGARVALYDMQKKPYLFGTSPLVVDICTDSTYFYNVRDTYCHPDSGYIRFGAGCIDTTLNLRPYVADIQLKIDPKDVNYSARDLRTKKIHTKGVNSGSIRLDGGKYSLKLSKQDYRRSVIDFNLTSDTTLVIDRQLQYCSPRLIISATAGISAEGTYPLGITVAYGGVHGIYARFAKSIANTTDGDSFDDHDLEVARYNPYSDTKGDYLSIVAGYQYYTPSGIYLQGGLGYAKKEYNWLSSIDNKRHAYSPDTNSGLVVDLGVGYPLGPCFVGISAQTIVNPRGDEEPYLGGLQSCAMISLGYIINMSRR